LKELSEGLQSFSDKKWKPKIPGIISQQKIKMARENKDRSLWEDMSQKKTKPRLTARAKGVVRLKRVRNFMEAGCTTEAP
jgi:hypothetical protein